MTNNIIGMYSLTKLANNLSIWQKLFTKYQNKYFINIYHNNIDKACHIAHLNDCYILSHIAKKFFQQNRVILQIHTHPTYGIKNCVKRDAVTYASNHNIPIVINAGHFAIGNLPYITNKYIPLLYWYGIDIYNNNINQYFNTTPIVDKLVVSFAGKPNNSKSINHYHNKGSNTIIDVLNRLKNMYSDKFDYILIAGKNYDECLRLKSLSHIVIDDINSGNYNQNGFEGLALGKVVVGNISENNQILFNALNSYKTNIPYININNGDDLFTYLEKCIINNEIDNLISLGKSNREWMEAYWNPRILLNERINLYNRFLDNDLSYYTNIVEKENFNTHTGGLITK